MAREESRGRRSRQRFVDSPQPREFFDKYHVSAANENLQEIRPILSEYQAHLKALQKGEDFTPELTGKSKKQKQKEKPKRGDEDEDMSEVEELVGDDIPRGKKRKHSPAPKARSSKKRRIIDDDDDDFLVDDDGELIFSDDDDDAKSSAHGPDTSDQGSDSEAEKDEDEDMNKSDDEEEEPVTEESLKAKIKEAQELVTQFRAELSSCREQRKTAMDALATLKKREGKAQRQKNAFCSRKRSEVCPTYDQNAPYTHATGLLVLQGCPEGGFPCWSQGS